MGRVKRTSEIAVVPIGYADGLNRKLSNGKGRFLVKGKQAPIIGNICMDMTMIDITGITAQEGDEVIIFGDEYPVDQIAKELGTIPYEILTGISDTGKGIPSQYLDTIFDRFAQIDRKKQGKAASVGLGLYFCKLVVEAHGGKIWAEAELENLPAGKAGGATFYFSLTNKGEKL